MIILGADPGVARLGWGAIETAGSRRFHLGHGVLTTLPGAAIETRLHHLHRGFSGLLEKYRPDVVAIEEIFFRKNVKTAIAVAEARGILLLAAAQAGARGKSLTPSAVKQGIVGWGGAEKHQVMEMVRILLGLATAPRPDDAADALAVAFVASLDTLSSRTAAYLR